MILIALVYLAWRTLKSWMAKNTTAFRPTDGRQPDALDDVMIQDPYCEVYFPQRNSVHLRHEGRDLYFCSDECKDRFLEEQGNSD